MEIGFKFMLKSYIAMLLQNISLFQEIIDKFRPFLNEIYLEQYETLTKYRCYMAF